MRRSIHSAVRFVPLTNALVSLVSLAFRPHRRESLLRQFTEAAVAAVDLAAPDQASTGSRRWPAGSAPAWPARSHRSSATSPRGCEQQISTSPSAGSSTGSGA